MRITKKGEYALRALVDLALNYKKGVRQIHEIVKNEGLPEKFLEQIFITLKNAGIINSKRGVGGGYYLNKPPNKISLGEIISVVEGPISPIECMNNNDQGCPKELTCGIRSIMMDIGNLTVELLNKITLAEICKRSKSLKEEKDESLMYYI